MSCKILFGQDMDSKRSPTTNQPRKAKIAATPPAIPTFPPAMMLFAAAVDVAALLVVAELATTEDAAVEVVPDIGAEDEVEALLEVADAADETLLADDDDVADDDATCEALLVQRPAAEDGTVTPAVLQRF